MIGQYKGTTNVKKKIELIILYFSSLFLGTVRKPPTAFRNCYGLLGNQK